MLFGSLFHTCCPRWLRLLSQGLVWVVLEHLTAEAELLLCASLLIYVLFFFFFPSYLDHSPPYIYICAQLIPFLDYSVIHVKQRNFWRSSGRGNTNPQRCRIRWGQVPRRDTLALSAPGHQARCSTTAECLQMCCWRGSGRLGQGHEKQHACFLEGGENVNKIRVIN